MMLDGMEDLGHLVEYNDYVSGTHDDEGTFFPDTDSWFPAMFGGREWVETSPFDGYFNTPLVKELIPLARGWMPASAVPGRYEENERFEELEQRLVETTKADAYALFMNFEAALATPNDEGFQQFVPPVPMWWLFEPTSDPRRYAVSMLCLADDELGVQRWLDSIGSPLNIVQDALRY